MQKETASQGAACLRAHTDYLSHVLIIIWASRQGAEGRLAAQAGRSAELGRELAVLEASSWEGTEEGKEFPYCVRTTVEISDWISQRITAWKKLYPE